MGSLDLDIFSMPPVQLFPTDGYKEKKEQKMELIFFFVIVVQLYEGRVFFLWKSIDFLNNLRNF